MSVVAELMDVARRHGCSAYYVDDGIWITTVGDLGHRAEWVLANEAAHGRLNTIHAPIGQLSTLLDRIIGVLRDPDFRHGLDVEAIDSPEVHRQLAYLFAWIESGGR